MMKPHHTNLWVLSNMTGQSEVAALPQPATAAGARPGHHCSDLVSNNVSQQYSNYEWYRMLSRMFITNKINIYLVEE